MSAQRVGTKDKIIEVPQGIWVSQHSANALTLCVSEDHWEIPAAAIKKHEQAEDGVRKILFSGDATQVHSFIGSLQRK